MTKIYIATRPCGKVTASRIISTPNKDKEFLTTVKQRGDMVQTSSLDHLKTLVWASECEKDGGQCACFQKRLEAQERELATSI